MIQKKNHPKPARNRGIHWHAMGAGLVTASLIYPEQQALLLSMGSSSFVMGIVEKLEKRNRQAAVQ